MRLIQRGIYEFSCIIYTLSLNSKLDLIDWFEKYEGFCGVEHEDDVGDERLEYGILLFSTPTSSAIRIRY